MQNNRVNAFDKILMETNRSAIITLFIVITSWSGVEQSIAAKPRTVARKYKSIHCYRINDYLYASQTNDRHVMSVHQNFFYRF